MTMRSFGVPAWAVLFALAGQAVAASAKEPVPVPEPPAVISSQDEYHLASGDKIRVNVFGEDTLSGDYIVTSAGNVTFPLIGNVPATDRSVEQLQDLLREKLADGYLKDPKVTIQVLTFRPYFIMGEVNRPGEYPVSTGLTLEQAIAAAGGYTYRANTRAAFLKKATETNEHLVDLRGAAPIIVHAGDTIRIRERHF